MSQCDRVFRVLNIKIMSRRRRRFAIYSVLALALCLLHFRKDKKLRTSQFSSQRSPLAFCSSETNFNEETRMQWNDYRIGDGISRQYGPPGCERYPRSIVCEYTKETLLSNDLDALTNVLTRFSGAEIERGEALLHVRLGDGLCARVDPACRGDRTSVPDCWNSDEDCWKDKNSETKQYAFSKEWYNDSIISGLQALNITRVVIFGDMFHWTRTSDPREGDFSVDKQYLSNIAEFFHRHHFETCVRRADFPDSDFATHVLRVFIQGGGGYSALIARVVIVRWCCAETGNLILPGSLDVIWQLWYSWQQGTTHIPDVKLLLHIFEPLLPNMALQLKTHDMIQPVYHVGF